MKRRLFILVLFLVCASLSLYAQFTPQGFNYQSIVRDGSGNPLSSQTVTLLFSVRSGAPNGPVAYSEKQSVSTNQFGLVNLVIGQGGLPLLGDFGSINWGGGSKYLTVSVETTPNVFDEIGTSQLMSVPYALYAQNVANGGGTGSGDNWGSQTVQTTATLSGLGTGGSPLTLAQQNAQAGQVLKWNGNTWAPSDDINSSGSNGGTVTQISTNAGITGGPITTSGTIGLSNTGVTPGPYGSATEIPVITVDAQGRVTNIFKTIVQPGTVGIVGSPGLNVLQNGFNFTITNTGDTNAADDITTGSQADGDVNGPFSNLQLKSGVVTSTELAANSVSTVKVANSAITAAKLDDMGAANGQVLKWNGTTWAASADQSGITTVGVSAGAGISVAGSSPNFTITNTGDTNANDDLTTASTANGDISGTFSNLQVKAAVINTTELANQAVTAAKLDDMGAANGQVLKWNGTTWAPATDLGGTFNVQGGDGIDVTSLGGTFTVINAGDTDPSDDVTTASQSGGDLSGPFSNLQLKSSVVTSAELASNAVITSKVSNGAITAAKLDNMGASSGQVLKWNGTTWAPAVDQTGSGGGSDTYSAGSGISVTGSAPNFVINNTGDTNAADDLTTSSTANGDVTGPFSDLQIKADVITTIELANAAVATSNLANQAVTAAKLDNMGANTGEILKWNGTTWVPSADQTGSGGGSTDTYLAGSGISVTGSAPNFVINNTGDTNAADDLTTSSTANGDVTGPFSDLQIKADVITTIELANSAVGTANLANQAVTAAKLDDMGANAGEVLKWDGMTWAPAAELSGGGGSYIAGTGINITGTAPNQTIVNTGDLSNTNEIQTLAILGNQLGLSNGGGSVTLPTGNTYIAGTGIGITGVAPNLTITNTGDADKSPTNEIQTLSLTGSTLEISNANSPIELAPLLTAGSVWKPAGVGGVHIYNSNTNNVLIGTNTSTSGKLQVLTGGSIEAARFVQNNTTGVAPAIYAQTSGTGPAGFFTSTNGKALITDAGFVGINTPAPSYRLDVTGGSRISDEGQIQLTLENQGQKPAILFFKNTSYDSGWFLNGRGDEPSRFEIQYSKSGAANSTVLSAFKDGTITLGDSSASSGSNSVNVNHGNTGGLLLRNSSTGNNWTFRVNGSNGNLQLYNNQLGAVPAGTFSIAGLYVPSDRRLKKDIVDLPGGTLRKILKINPVAYRYEVELESAPLSIGFLAQDVQTQFPELVAENGDYLSLNYAGFGVLAIKAIQEQQAEIDLLKKQNESLQQQMQTMESRLQRLEQATADQKN